jgi:hypothetical protein
VGFAPPLPQSCGNGKIREAILDPFVRHYLSEKSKKSHSPSPWKTKAEIGRMELCGAFTMFRALC